MKAIYEKPRFLISEFSAEEVLASSGVYTDGLTQDYASDNMYDQGFVFHWE